MDKYLLINLPSQQSKQNTFNGLKTSRATVSLLSVRGLQSLFICLLLSTQLACSTVYLHDSASSNVLSKSQMLDHSNSLPFKQTQHDGFVMAFSKDNSINMGSSCGEQGWKTIKIESNMSDLVIRAIANPIWGTATVEYDCKDRAVAHVGSKQSDHHLIP